MHLHPHGLFCCIQILHILLNPKSQFSPSFIHRPLVISHFAALHLPVSCFQNTNRRSRHHPITNLHFLVPATSRFSPVPSKILLPRIPVLQALSVKVSLGLPQNNDESLSRQRLASSALPGHTTHQAPSPASWLRMVNGMAFTTSPPLDVNNVTDVT